MQAYSPPTITPPVIRTPAEAKDYYSHYPLIEAKSKLYRVMDVRGEGVRTLLGAAAAKLIKEGWGCWVLTDVHGKTSLFVSLKDRNVADMTNIMRRFSANEFGNIQADPDITPNPAELSSEIPELIFPN